MSVTIEWQVPSSVSSSSSTYKINVYESQNGEDGDYTAVANIDATSGGSYVSNYTYSSGANNYYYYVRYYTYPGGSEGSKVLAWIEPTVKEQRLIEAVQRNLPRDVTTKFGDTTRETKDAINFAVQAINVIQPLTSYTIGNMPKTWEAPVIMFATIATYASNLLNIAITDFSSNDNGLSLNRDRGAKVNQAMKELLGIYNELVKYIKMKDYPNPIGLGSEAISVPMGRFIDILYNI